MSPDDAAAMVWNDDIDDVEMEEDEEDLDRLYTFEVSKTKDQEEDVKIRQGFTVRGTCYSYYAF